MWCCGPGRLFARSCWAIVLVACRTGPESPTSAAPSGGADAPSSVEASPSSSLDDAPRPLEPGSRYAVTFSAADETCRGYTFSHEGAARLVTDAEGRSVFEVETTSADPFEGMDIQLSPPPQDVSRTTVCRWSGSASPGSDGPVVHLVLEAEADDPRCGGTLTMACRSQRMTVPDGEGVEASIPVVSCRVHEPMPAPLWVLTPAEDIILSAEGLRSEVRRVPMGMNGQRLVRTAR